MPLCLCGVAFESHLEVVLGVQSAFNEIGGVTVNAYFCPGPMRQTPALVTALATVYTPSQIVTPAQLAAET